MCTYNGSEFLPEQLNSIAMQTRLPDELVVCDDKSSDNTIPLLRQFEQRASFEVRVIENEENLGFTKNFEKAISHCQGDIIALADQDDIWLHYKLHALERRFLETPDCVAAFSDADIVDCSSLPTDESLWDSVGFSVEEQRRFETGLGWTVLVKHPVVTGATLAFRQDMCRHFLPVPDHVTHDRWISSLLAIEGPIAILREPLMRYRTHRKQQIGIGPQSMRGRIKQARLRGEDFYKLEIDFLRQLCVRLEACRSRLQNAEDAIREARRKMSHLETRVQLRRRSVARIPEVLREMLNGGYWRYSAGWESVAKDLFLLGAS